MLRGRFNIRNIVFLAIAMISLATVSVAASGEPIGSVATVSGKATAERNRQQVDLHVGDPVYEADVLKTGYKSSLIVSLNGDSNNKLRMGQRSVMRVESYKVASDGQITDGLLNAVIGTFRLNINKLMPGSKFLLKTVTATAGVRGTVYGVSVAADGTTYVRCTKGSITVTVGGRTVTVGAGQVVAVSSSGVAAAAKPVADMTAEENNAMDQGDTTVFATSDEFASTEGLNAIDEAAGDADDPAFSDPDGAIAVEEAVAKEVSADDSTTPISVTAQPAAAGGGGDSSAN